MVTVPALRVVAVGAIGTVAAIRAVGAVASVLTVTTVAAVTTVLAVATVAVVVAVLLLRHVDTVDDDGHVRQLLVGTQSVDQLEAGLRGEVGTAHIYGDVAHTTDLQGIGNQSYRGSIDDDIVVFVAQDLEDLIQRLT